jgi:RNA polymerase sigma-32 factor
MTKPIIPLTADQQALVAQWRGLVLKIVRELGYGNEDVVSEGYLGLCRAAQLFDPERKVKFSTYAGYWVRAYALLWYMKKSKTFPIGNCPEERKIFYRIGRASRHVAKFGKPATPENIAECLGEKEEMVARVLNKMRPGFQYQHAYSGGGNIEPYGRNEEFPLPDEKEPADEMLISHELQPYVRRKLAEHMDNFDKREQMIIRQRFLAERPRTLLQIGRKFNVSRERIRQIEAALLAKLRKIFVMSQGPSEVGL